MYFAPVVIFTVFPLLTLTEATDYIKRQLSDDNPWDEFENQHYPSVGDAVLCGLHCKMNSCNMFVIHNEQCWTVDLVVNSDVLVQIVQYSYFCHCQRPEQEREIILDVGNDSLQGYIKLNTFNHVAGVPDDAAKLGIWIGTCIEQDGMYRDPLNCAKFYHCSNGTPHQKTCDSGLYFNLDSKICDFGHNVFC